MSSSLPYAGKPHHMACQASCAPDIAESPEVKLAIKQASTFDADPARSPDDIEMMEERMRRALGLGGPSARPILTTPVVPPHRNVGGPVTPGSARHKRDSMGGGSTATGAPSPLQQRVTELERQLAVEQQKHGKARQLLRQTELAVRSLETRSQHDALTQQEELDREHQATMQAHRALDNALFELQQRTDTRRSAAASALGQVNLTTAEQTLTAIRTRLDMISSATPVDEPSPPKKRGRPRSRPLPEPKPVRWWTLSYRAKMKD